MSRKGLSLEEKRASCYRHILTHAGAGAALGVLGKIAIKLWFDNHRALSTAKHVALGLSDLVMFSHIAEVMSERTVSGSEVADLLVEAGIAVAESGTVILVNVALDGLDTGLPAELEAVLRGVGDFSMVGIAGVAFMKFCETYFGAREKEAARATEAVEHLRKIFEEITINIDPFEEALSKEEFEFKQLLKDAFERSWAAFNDDKLEQVLVIWAPLLDNSFFQTGHAHWADKPFFQARIQNGRSHVAIAAAVLGCQREYDTALLTMAYRCLQDLLAIGPYSMAGGSSTRLDADEAREQNKFYLWSCRQLYRGFHDNILPWLKACDVITNEEDQGICEQMRSRIAELEACLAR